jgi:hypothetical protein
MTPSPITTSKASNHRDRREQSPRAQRVITLNCLRPDQLSDLFFDLVHLGEAIQGMLGEDLSPVEKDLERSRLTGGDRHRPQLFVVIVQQILRQTGGSREIPSGGAVLDPHRWLLPGRLTGSVTGHDSPPFASQVHGRVDPIPQRLHLTRVSHGRLSGTTASHRAICRTPRAGRGG